ncbi:hypothetical protein ACI6Q2_02860 [Chitinophagaceae bacterium LWZ2-11]
MTTVLMLFLKENDLIKFDPFNEGDVLKRNLETRKSHLTEIGNLILIKYIPKWSDYVDRSCNIKILKKGLVELKGGVG